MQKIIVPQKTDRPTLLCSLIIAFLCLFLKNGPHYFPGIYLWTDDANFISEASSLGIKALWTPYEGYFHLYDRLIAFICHFFSLKIGAFVFSLAWLACFYAMIRVIVKRALSFGLPPTYIYWLVILIILQPSASGGTYFDLTTGEIFFTLAFSQWPLWAALGLYILARDNTKPSLSELAVVTLGTLSGPFCFFIFPVFFVKSLIEKNLKNTWVLNFILFLGAMLIAKGLLARTQVPIPHDIGFGAKIQALISILSFRANRLTAIIAIFFWICFLISFIRLSLAHARHKEINLLWYLLAFSGICVIAAIYVSATVFLDSPLTVPDRYTWIPYTLFFFCAAIAATGSKRMLWLSFLSMTVLCVIHFHTIHPRDNYQFASYVNFSNYVDVKIPINAGYRFNPAGQSQWNIHRTFTSPKSPSILPQKLDIRDFSTNGLKAKMVNNFIEIQANSHGSKTSLIFNKPIYCPAASDIGIILSFDRMQRDSMLINKEQREIVQLFWSKTKVFRQEASIPYYAPGERATAQFAFPNPQEKIYLQIKFINLLDEIHLKNLDFYCLP